MSTDFGSIFHYAGNIQDMKLKIILSRLGPGTESSTGEPKSIICDEVACSWKESVSRQVHAKLAIIRTINGSLVMNDQSLGFLPNLSITILKRLSLQSPLEPFRIDDLMTRRSTMNIYAFLGDMADADETHFHDAHVCRITAIGEGKTLVFEPPLTSGGFRLEGKLGDYVARVQIFDDGFSSLTEDFARMEMLNLPDIGMFDLSDENALAISYNIAITTGRAFPFDAVQLEWLILDRYLTNNSTSHGSTGSIYPTTNETWNFSYIFNINLNIPIMDMGFGISNPTVLVGSKSEDGWGRQWIAGHATFTLPLLSGTSKQTLHFWKLADSDPAIKLKEFFIGSCQELDMQTFLKDCGQKMLGMRIESSGSIDIEISTVIHSRHIMAKDTLQHVKYGSQLSQLGVMKVLLEFEDARQMLLRTRKAQ